MQPWYYDEFQQTGLDYSDALNVETYDKQMQRFRDYKKEAETIMKFLDLTPKAHVLEIGTGTGHFAIEAAGVYKMVTAFDTSKGMLEYAKQKAKQYARTNIKWINKGFLSLDDTKKYDAVVTNMALHHLPDFWKAVAFNNIYRSLKQKGKLYLGDVIFSFDPSCYREKIEVWMKDITELLGGKKMKKEAVMHISEEYSTYDWVIEKLLHISGFRYKIIHKDNFKAVYLAVKD